MPGTSSAMHGAHRRGVQFSRTRSDDEDERSERHPDRRRQIKPVAFARMSTCVVTGGAGFLGSHLCEHLLGQGHRVICIDNLETGSLQNIDHIRDDPSSSATSTSPSGRRPRGRRLRLPPRLAGEPDRLPAAAAAPLKVGSHGTHHMLGSPSSSAPASCSPRPARSTATPRSTRRRRTTGATSTRSARAASTTRRSATPRR